MEIKVDKTKKTLTVTLPISPKPSKSGKTTVIASTHGNLRVSEMWEGKPITIGINAYVPKG